uniref:Uncharacterized protein n=1 Tax=Arundo donax TaxID=35708 RepID=A0A0A9ES37_ARUDO
MCKRLLATAPCRLLRAKNPSLSVCPGSLV